MPLCEWCRRQLEQVTVSVEIPISTVRTHGLVDIKADFCSVQCAERWRDAPSAAGIHGYVCPTHGVPIEGYGCPICYRPGR